MAHGYPDFEGQKSKLFTVADWAAIEATDKNFDTSAVSVVWNGSVYVAYTVPADKTLFMCGMSMSMSASAAADYDQLLNVLLELYNITEGYRYASVGGNGGAWMTFPKPIAIPKGKEMRLYGFNRSNINCIIRLAGWGYEV